MAERGRRTVKKAFPAEHPILFEIILIIAAYALALVFWFVGQALYLPVEVSIAIDRILAGLLLLIIFHKCFEFKKWFSGFVIMLPALLFAVWNIALCFIAGGGNPSFDASMLIFAFAPAIFEEVLFRGIFIHNLQENGKEPIQTLLISAALFGVIHLTNIVGMPPAQVLVQTGYAFVVGLVLGAIYIRSGDLASLIIAHFLIDFTSRVFPGGETTPIPMIIAFIILMIAEAGYAFFLVRKGSDQGVQRSLT